MAARTNRTKTTTARAKVSRAGSIAGLQPSGHTLHIGDSAIEQQLASVPSPVRMQMQLIAQAASSADNALSPIIDLLVDGSAEKRAAIVVAFRTNEALRAQWERTYQILRS